MPVRTLSSWQPIALGALVAGVAASGWAWYESTADYVSIGVMVARRSLLPQPILATEPITTLDVNRTTAMVLSRASLTNLVHTHDLYGAERAAQPLEDVLEQMRKSVKVERTGDEGWRISYGYRDALKAQGVNKAILSGIEDEMKRQRSSRIDHAVEFIESRRAKLRRTQNGQATPVAVPPSEPTGFTVRYGPVDPGSVEPRSVYLAPDRPDDLKLDPAQRRREEEMLGRELAMIRLWRDLEDRRQGPRLDVLKPADLPDGNLIQKYLPWSAVGVISLGALAGGLLGMLAAAAYRMARGREQIA